MSSTFVVIWALDISQNWSHYGCNTDFPQTHNPYGNLIHVPKVHALVSYIFTETDKVIPFISFMQLSISLCH